MEKLIAVGVPSGAVFDTKELIDEPSFEQRGFMQTVKQHNGEYKMASWPVRIDGKSVRLKGSPALGQATAPRCCKPGSASMPAGSPRSRARGCSERREAPFGPLATAAARECLWSTAPYSGNALCRLGRA